MIYKYLLLIIFAFTLSNCTSTRKLGEDFQLSNIQKITKSVTTRSDIQNMFGEPKTKEIKTNNIEQWDYAFYTSEKDIFTNKKKVYSKFLVIIFKKGIVYDFEHLEKYENK